MGNDIDEKSKPGAGRNGIRKVRRFESPFHQKGLRADRQHHENRNAQMKLGASPVDANSEKGEQDTRKNPHRNRVDTTQWYDDREVEKA